MTKETPMQGKTGSLGLCGILFFAGAVLFPGCVSVSTPKSLEIGGKPVYRVETDDPTESYESQKISKDEVYTIAKDRAVNEGARLPEYDIRDKKVHGYYWVFFERKNPAKARTWKNHFVVRVSMFGRSSLFKPSARPSGASGRTIKKDDAYDVAHRVAYREGARIKGYEIHDKEVNGAYWVMFETKHYHKKAGWKNHFAVRVSRYGEAEMYR
jgi:hypothetical protein